MKPVIAFDYGGVIEISITNLIDEIVRYLNVDKNVWSQKYFSLNHLCNTGQNTWEEVLLLTAEKVVAGYLSYSQIEHLKELIKNDTNSKVINHELIELIKELRKEHKIALMSNYATTLRSKLSDQGLSYLFDEIIISGEVGYQKPQPEIFILLCNKMRISPSELIFIDDSKRSLEGAEVIGYTPILFTNNQALREELLSILKSQA